MNKVLVSVLMVIALVTLPAVYVSAEESASDISKLPEKERYILANAELACYSMTALKSGSKGKEGDQMEAITEKYGFTPEELDELSSKYPGSESEVGMQSRKMCPDAWKGFQKFYGSSPDAWKQKGDSKNLDYWKNQ